MYSECSNSHVRTFPWSLSVWAQKQKREESCFEEMLKKQSPLCNNQSYGAIPIGSAVIVCHHLAEGRHLSYFFILIIERLNISHEKNIILELFLKTLKRNVSVMVNMWLTSSFLLWKQRPWKWLYTISEASFVVLRWQKWQEFLRTKCVAGSSKGFFLKAL